jgi:hypothetical protein
MWIRVALVCLLLTLTISTASAQDEGGGPSDSAARAAGLIDEGVELRKAGKEREALAKFREAYELEATPRALAQMALAEKSLRSYVDAEGHFEDALADADDPWIAKNREALETAKSYVANQLAWLVVTTNVAKAQLSVNGTVVGELPLSKPHRIVAGLTVVEVRRDGYVDGRSESTLVADEVTEIRIDLEKLQPSKPGPAARPAPLPPSPDAPPPTEHASWTPWILTSAGISAVGLGIGIGLGVHTLNLKSDRNAICPEQNCTTQAGVDLDEKARAMALGSTVSFVLAGAAAVATLVLWLVEPDDDPPNTGVSLDASTASFRF